MEKEKLTPMMIQWSQCKKQAKDALVLFRLGDFYEAFYDDAETIAKAIQLTLTKRQGTPMCGVPVQTLEMYLDKLIQKGFKVAIAEQMEDPRSVKGIVKREIVRIVSPGTLVSSQLIQEKSNNFFISLSQIGGIYGLSLIDLTTSEFRVMEIEDSSELVSEIYRLRPAELLVSKRFLEAHQELMHDLKCEFTFLLNTQENIRFDPNPAAQVLTAHFEKSLTDLHISGMMSAISAAGALLSYLKEELILDLSHIKKLQNEKLSGYMSIDKTSLRNLDILPHENSQLCLLSLLDQTETPMGGRLLARWVKHPLLSCSKIEERLHAVEELTQNVDTILELQSSLSQIRDLQRLIMKVESGYASPKDLDSLSSSLQTLPSLRSSLEGKTSNALRYAKSLLLDASPIIKIIDEALVDSPPMRLHDGRTIRPGFHAELDEYYTISRDSKEWIARYQSELREELGIKTLKVGYTKVFGYYIDVSSAQSSKVPADFQRKQTLVNSERFISEKLKSFEHKILTAEERIRALEGALFDQLKKSIAAYDEVIQSIAKGIAFIDVFASFAKVALEYQYAKPRVSEDDLLQIEGGRHPIIEKTMGFSDFIDNDTQLDEQQRLYLITGPNMAGKSTYIRQVALISIMAQMGSFIPAKSAHIGIIDKVFSRIGASDDLSRGQSTFMVEMSQTAHILNTATSRSLVILDEIGRGTSTYDGISIAWAVAEFLLTTKEKKAKTLFATHYWELTKMEGKIPGAVNFQVAVKETDAGIVFLRKIIQGGTDKSYGIHVARLAGLPTKCIKKAEEMLLVLEKENRKTPPKKAEEQLSLFSKAEEKLAGEIDSMNLNQMTPMDALSTLFELQKKVKKTMRQSHNFRHSSKKALLRSKHDRGIIS